MYTEECPICEHDQGCTPDMQEVTCSKCGHKWRPNSSIYVIYIHTGFNADGYISEHGAPQLGEHLVIGGHGYVVDSVLSRRRHLSPNHPFRRHVRALRSSRENWNSATLGDLAVWGAEDLIVDDLNMPRIKECVKFGTGEQKTYFRVADIVWHTVTFQGVSPDREANFPGIEPRIYLHQVERVDWTDRISSELRVVGQE